MWGLPWLGIKPAALHWQADSLSLSHQGIPVVFFFFLVRKFFTPFLNEDPFVKIHRQNFRIFTCMSAKSLQSCLALCSPKDCSPQAPLSMGFSRWEDWSGLPCPPPGDLPNPGTEPATLRSPELAGRCFASSATWEVPISRENWFFWLLEINDVFSLKYQKKQGNLWSVTNEKWVLSTCILFTVVSLRFILFSYLYSPSASVLWL